MLSEARRHCAIQPRFSRGAGRNQCRVIDYTPAAAGARSLRATRKDRTNTGAVRSDWLFGCVPANGAAHGRSISSSVATFFLWRLLIKWLRRPKLVVQTQGVEAWSSPSKAHSQLLKRADLVLCVSRRTRAAVLHGPRSRQSVFLSCRIPALRASVSRRLRSAPPATTSK
jgi:hypothetical protein